METEETYSTTITISEGTRRRFESLFGSKQSWDESLSHLLEEKEILKAIVSKMVGSDRVYSAAQEIYLILINARLQNLALHEILVGLKEKVDLTGDVRLQELYNRLIGMIRQGIYFDFSDENLQRFIVQVFELWSINANRINQSIEDLRKMTESIKNSPEKTVFLEDEVELQIYSIIETASKFVTFVTPYLDLWLHLQSKIEKAISRGVVFSFIVRKDWIEDKENTANTKNRKKKIKEDIDWLHNHDVKVYAKERLHAKIYVNESTLLISSMNVTEPSVNNSLDLALIVKNPSDAWQLRNYVSELIETSQLIYPSVKVADRIGSTNRGQTQVTMGRCIRCGTQVTFNPRRPLCENCYQSWVNYQNTSYPESLCHSCGEPSSVTYARPLCRTCYQKYS